MQSCDYTDAASLAAALSDAGCDATGADCSARCAETLLPLVRECTTMMGPYRTLASACMQTERGGSRDRFDADPEEVKAL